MLRESITMKVGFIFLAMKRINPLTCLYVLVLLSLLANPLYVAVVNDIPIASIPRAFVEMGSTGIRYVYQSKMVFIYGGYMMCVPSHSRLANQDLMRALQLLGRYRYKNIQDR